MSEKKGLSGSQKRKLKKEKEEAIAKLPKITSMFKKQEEKDDSSAGVPELVNGNETQQYEDANEMLQNVQINETTVSETDVHESRNSNELNLSEPYPSDRGHFSNNVSHKLKLEILKFGSCKPQGPFPRDFKGRCFSTSYYFINNNSKALRIWLCYSIKLNRVYCEPCWLFSEKDKGNNNWIEGICDWQGLSKKIKEHEISQNHMYACALYSQWKSNKTIDIFSNEYKESVSFWKQVLTRLIDITSTLAASNISFRGHREYIGQSNNGNFLSIVELLSRYDPILAKLIDKNNNLKIKYLSPKIQNELIELLSTSVKNQIIFEILSCPFFSIICDTTQDITKQDQLSIIIRYVTEELDSNGVPCNIKINESFLGFTNLTDQSAKGIENAILELLEKKNIQINNCRGQGYDGASVMSGVYNGLQKKICEREPNAVYVHCAAHNLNLVLKDAVCVQPVQQFFDIIQQLYTFFSASIKRWELLLNVNAMSYKNTESKKGKPTLKKLCPTRWSSRHDALFAVYSQYADIMKTLSRIALISKSKDECNEANTLKKYMETFEFLLNVIVQNKILNVIDIVSKSLQNVNIDVEKASQLLSNAINNINTLRNQFDEIKAEAVIIAENWGISTSFSEKRNRKSKKFFDELCSDQRLNDPEQYYKVNVFYQNLDIIISQLKIRFMGMDKIVNKFKFLFPTNLIKFSDLELIHHAENLVEQYSKDLTLSFVKEILSFRTVLFQSIQQTSTVAELADLLIVQNNCMLPSVQEVATAFKLFLTIPVTSATAERSFSKLKLIKNYLRSTMAQPRLSDLSVLSIENDRIRSLDLNTLVKDFAQKNARRSQRFK